MNENKTSLFIIICLSSFSLFFSIANYNKTEEITTIEKPLPIPFEEIKKEEERKEVTFEEGKKKITLDVLNESIEIEFVDNVSIEENKENANITGAFFPLKRLIQIKKRDKVDMYATISHEASHYAWFLTNLKGIKDNETTAYIVGYVTGEAIKMIK